MSDTEAMGDRQTECEVLYVNGWRAHDGPIATLPIGAWFRFSARIDVDRRVFAHRQPISKDGVNWLSFERVSAAAASELVEGVDYVVAGEGR